MNYQIGYEEFFDDNFYREIENDVGHDCYENILKPIKTLSFILIDEIRPNNYNPNRLPRETLRLLYLSIVKNGWTLPIVVKKIDNDKNYKYEIVDGYHRYFLASKTNLRNYLENKIPAVIINPQKNLFEYQCATILHNKARGVHLVQPMQEIVSQMVDDKIPISVIAKRTGMSVQEIFRLSLKSKNEFMKLMAEEKENKTYTVQELVDKP